MTGRDIWEALTRPRGNTTWDGVLRSTGLLALLGIPVVLLVPEGGALIGFVLVTIWVNGPLAFLLPATYEPILMLFGRLYAPVLIATLGTGGTLYVEFLNYHLYRKVLDLKVAERFREKRWVERVVALFRRAPFFTVWLCSWSILPYWTVRFLSPLAGYSIRKHLFATLLGRFPRLWFFAALGVWWGISSKLLLAITVATIALAVGVWLFRRWRRGSKRGSGVDDTEAAEIPVGAAPPSARE